jgi:hypothetical protein
VLGEKLEEFIDYAICVVANTILKLTKKSFLSEKFSLRRYLS